MGTAEGRADHAAAHPAVAEILGPLAALSEDRRELFALRLDRWLPDLRAGLRAVYPAEQATATEARLIEAAALAYAQRPHDLHLLDQARTLAPDWFQAPQMLGYAAYADRFGATLTGVADQIPYLTELGVTYLHLMPLLRPREGDNDGGYAVADYRAVRADLGTVDDLRTLTADLRKAGISIVLDLVLNHVAREHEWARAARDGDPRYRDYFYAFDDRTIPDTYEKTLPEVFPAFAPGNFTFDEELGAWVWTTFNSFQWDVNWSNPDVLCEYSDIVLWMANAGVDVIRLDAIAFLWKRLGTDCQNQPEVHSITQVLRSLLRIAAPAVLLKAEAIVAPTDLVHYLGTGRHHGKVSDLAYHNSLMVQVWSMLASRDVRLAVRTLQDLPAVPSTTAWICYLRCHDDIGWAIEDAACAKVGLDGYAHRAFLSDFYSGDFPDSFARGLIFQHNPATGDRRVSGMTSALTGLETVGADPAAIKTAIDRILLGYAIVLGWGGIPVLWMGDEIGLPGDAGWAGEVGHESDNRWVHRPRMDPDRQAQRHVAGTVAAQVWDGMRHLVATRAARPELHAGTQSQVLDASDPGVLAVLRRHPEGTLLELFNVTDEWRWWPAARFTQLGIVEPYDVLSGYPVIWGENGNVHIAPYRALWVVDYANR
jgi:amylosucrase